MTVPGGRMSDAIEMRRNVCKLFLNRWQEKNFVGDTIICKIVSKKKNPNPIIYRITVFYIAKIK